MYNRHFSLFSKWLLKRIERKQARDEIQEACKKLTQAWSKFEEALKDLGPEADKACKELEELLKLSKEENNDTRI